MRFFDAHCDTIGKIWEAGADFSGGSADAGPPSDNAGEALSYHPGGENLHVTLPGLRAAGVSAQVFASWAWTERYKGREFETAMAEVQAVRRLCDEFPDDLVLALTGAQIEQAFAAPAPARDAMAAAGTPAAPGPTDGRIAVIPGLEGTDALLGEVDNLLVFRRAGVRILTLAWRDTPFCGSTYGNGTGLTDKGTQLVEACEDARVLVDLSHASDQTFADVCRVAKRPFVASHSNCRAICPSARNLTDEMIRAIGERGGVVGITLAPGFLSTEYYHQTKVISDEFWLSVDTGAATVDQAGKKSAEAEALIARPPLDPIVDHVRHAINIGGEDAVGLGGDLDGVDALPAGFTSVADYPTVAELLHRGGLAPAQIEKVCHANMTRVFKEVLG